MSRARLRHTVLALALVAGVGGAAVVPAGAQAAPRATTGSVRAADAPLPGEWWRSAMGVDELNRSGTGKGVTVAVIDGPIDPTVPELRGKVVSSRSYCETPGGATGRLLSPSAKGKVAEHATSMASLIAGTGKGTGPGGRGITGIAPDVRIRHYAVLYRDTDGESQCVMRKAGGDNVDQAIADAMAQAADDGADVISISLIAGFDEDMIDSLLAAYRGDAVVVAGTPNTRTDPQWPGLGNGVVLVNSVDRAGRIPDFAVHNSSFIGLTAPGKDVMAGSYDGSGWHSDTLVSGSSIATALVSGGIAALRSAHPDAGAGQVLQAVKDTVGLRPKKGGGYETWFRRSGTDLPTVKKPNAAYGWGIFDPADAVRVDPTSLPEDNPFVRDSSVADPTREQIAAATGSGSPSASSSATPTASPAASSPSARAAAPAAGDDGSGTPWLPVGGGVLVLVLLAAGGAFLLGRRGSSPAAPPPAAPTPDGPTDSTPTTTTTTTDGALGAEGRKH